MERIKILLGKINELAESGRKNTSIEIDLMLDYTRVLYADLLELRKKTFAAVLVSEEMGSSPLTNNLAKGNMVTVSTAAAVVTPAQPSFTPQVKDLNQKDIRNLIGINDKYLFISELFNNEKDAYEHLLDDINDASNEHDAKEMVNATAGGNYAWNDDNETVELFYNLLKKFFATI